MPMRRETRSVYEKQSLVWLSLIHETTSSWPICPLMSYSFRNGTWMAIDMKNLISVISLLIVFLASCGYGEVDVEVKAGKSSFFRCPDVYNQGTSSGASFTIYLEEKKGDCNAECDVNIHTYDSSGKKHTHGGNGIVLRGGTSLFYINTSIALGECKSWELGDHDCSPKDCTPFTRSLGI